jgi:FK506-binding protein 2
MTIPQVEGLQVEVKAEGTGTRETKAGDEISVHYSGTLLDGTPFDDSYSRGSPLKFPVGAGHVIQGWDQGLLGMKIGEKRKLTIAPHLAYGDRAMGSVIKKNSTLVFETELVSITGVAPGQ